MKKMKSKVMIALVLGMMLLCTACGDNPSKENVGNGTPTSGAATSGAVVPSTEVTTPTATPTATPVPLREVALDTEFTIAEDERVAVGDGGIELLFTYSDVYEEYDSVSVGCQLFVDGEVNYCTGTWRGVPTELSQDPGTQYELHVFGATEGEMTLMVTAAREKQPALDLSDWTEEYYTTDKREYMEGDFFVLYLDEGVTLSKDTVENLNQVITWAEEETGMKLNNDSRYSEYRDVGMLEAIFGYGAFPGMPQDPGREKIQIIVAYNVGGTGASLRTIYIDPLEMQLTKAQGSNIIAAVVSVITHTNGVGPGMVLETGYGMYVAEEIVKKYETRAAFLADVDYETLSAMSAEEAAEAFTTMNQRFNDEGGYGYCFLTYLMETYGADVYENIVTAAHGTVLTEYDPYPNPTEIKDIVEQNTDANVFAGFVQWLAENEDRF